MSAADSGSLFGVGVGCGGWFGLGFWSLFVSCFIFPFGFSFLFSFCILLSGMLGPLVLVFLGDSFFWIFGVVSLESVFFIYLSWCVFALSFWVLCLVCLVFWVLCLVCLVFWVLCLVCSHFGHPFLRHGVKYLKKTSLP